MNTATNVPITMPKTGIAIPIGIIPAQHAVHMQHHFVDISHQNLFKENSTETNWKKNIRSD